VVLSVKGLRVAVIVSVVRASIREWLEPHIISVENLHVKERSCVLVVAFCYSIVVRCARAVSEV